jgi:hypothetical protein
MCRVTFECYLSSMEVDNVSFCNVWTFYINNSVPVVTWCEQTQIRKSHRRNTKTEMKCFEQLCFVFVINLRISPCLISKNMKLIFFLWLCCPTLPMASSFLRFLDHKQRQTTVGRTPPDEWSARRGDFYLTTHNTHTRQIFVTPAGFEPTIPTSERPQTHTRPLLSTKINI